MFGIDLDYITFMIYDLHYGLIFTITVLGLLLWVIINSVVSKKGKKPQLIWHIVNIIFVCISFISILYYTVIDRANENVQWMPFIRPFELISERPELIREMVMNAFLFFPLGLTAPYVLERLTCVKSQRNRVVIFTIISALILTCTIELIQYLYNFGNCELSDIVMNTLGAAIGSMSYLVSDRLRR